MKKPAFFTEKWDTKGVPTIGWEGLLRTPKVNVKKAELAFLTAAHILKGAGITFWLSSGTALGAVRDKGIIPIDIDVDLTILAKDYDIKRFAKMFYEASIRYAEKIYPPLYGDLASGIVVRPHGIRVDIDLIYYYPPDDLHVALDVKPHCMGTIQPGWLHAGPRFIDFLGIPVRIPYPPEQYLERLYGRGWNVDCTDWSWMDLRKPISIDKYVKYFHEYPEANK